MGELLVSGRVYIYIYISPDLIGFFLLSYTAVVYLYPPGNGHTSPTSRQVRRWFFVFLMGCVRSPEGILVLRNCTTYCILVTSASITMQLEVVISIIYLPILGVHFQLTQCCRHGSTLSCRFALPNGFLSQIASWIVWQHVAILITCRALLHSISSYIKYIKVYIYPTSRHFPSFPLTGAQICACFSRGKGDERPGSMRRFT